MAQLGTAAAVLSVHLAALLAALALLPYLVSGAKLVQVPCKSISRDACSLSCNYVMVQEGCCRCYGDCCKADTEVNISGDGSLRQAAAGEEDADGSETAEKLEKVHYGISVTAGEQAEQADRKPLEPLILRSKCE